MFLVLQNKTLYSNNKDLNMNHNIVSPTSVYRPRYALAPARCLGRLQSAADHHNSKPTACETRGLSVVAKLW